MAQPDRPKLGLPESAFQTHVNLNPFPEFGSLIVAGIVLKESQMHDAIVAKYKNDPKVFLDLRKKDSYTFEEAREIATAEAACLLQDFPQLIVPADNFPNLYRMLRTAELSHGIARGNTAVLVGSGFTLDEPAAVLVEPPTNRRLIDFFYESSPLLLQKRVAYFTEKFNKNEPFPIPPFRKGAKVIAIEPDASLVKMGKEHSHYYGLTAENTTIVEYEVAEAIAQRLIPLGIDLIIWNRAESAIMFGADEKGSKPVNPFSKLAQELIKRETFSRLLYALTAHLSPEGNFVFTVGTGNNDQQLEARKKMLAATIEALPKMGLTVIPKFSGFYKDWRNPDSDEMKYFGQRNAGHIGAVIGKKYGKNS